MEAIKEIFINIVESGFSGGWFNLAGFISSIFTIWVTVFAFIKLILTPIKSYREVKGLYRKGSDDVRKGNLDAGREYLKQVIDYPAKLGTNAIRCYAQLNYGQSFFIKDSAPLDDLKIAEVEYDRLEKFLLSKGSVKRFFFRYIMNVYVVLCVNRVDLLNKLYTQIQDDELLLPALIYGETAITSLKDERLMALVKSTTATTLRILAEKLNSVENLERSICYSEDALAFYERKGDTKEEIRVHNNLGNAFQLMCFVFTERDSEEFSRAYQAAHSHYAQATEKCSYKEYPEAYARNYMNLGVLIYEYVCTTPEGKPEHLYKAKECLAKALKVYTLEEFPFEYASCKMKLLMVASCQGAASCDEKLIRDAIADGEDALSVFTAQKYPENNMKLHHFLGFTYDFLARVVTDDDAFVDCCKKAIEHLEFIALEQVDPVAILRTNAKLIMLSNDILLVEQISDEDRLKYSDSMKKYHQKMLEIQDSFPDEFETFKKELPEFSDGAEDEVSETDVE